MSANPPVPEGLRPLAPGYSPRQVQLDAQMTVLGRPTLPMRALLDKAALAKHRADVEAWEHAHPDDAVAWLELYEDAKAEDARLYEEAYGPEAYARERLLRAGFEEPLLHKASGVLTWTGSMNAARDWLNDGTRWALLLLGKPGCGKSQAATWVATQAAQRFGFAPMAVRCRRESEAPLYGMQAEWYRQQVRTSRWVLLDDLGEGEQMSEKRSAWRAWVNEVLSERYAHRLKTVVTSNRSPAELRAWLGESIWDRLRDGQAFGSNEPSLRGREPGEEG